MSRFALNIGMDIGTDYENSETGSVNVVAAILGTAFAFGFTYADSGEKTLVIEVDADPDEHLADLRSAALEICEALEQDCIAFARLNESGEPITGELIGPRKELWGNFDPSKFLSMEDCGDVL